MAHLLADNLAMPLLFVTGNRHKFSEAAAMLPGIAMFDVDLPEIQSDDAEEIILAKLAHALTLRAEPMFVEDTSLHLDALHGLPGPLVKWFLKALGCDGLARLSLDCGTTRATARCLIGFSTPGRGVRFFEGSVAGEIVLPRGDAAFGWDPIFVPEGADRTFAEMSAIEKNARSHRRLAFDAFREFLALG